VTTAADVFRVAWNHATGDLWASGAWGDKTLSLRIVDIAKNVVRAPLPPVLFSNSRGGDFDLTRDGHGIVFARQDLRGDLWFQDLGPTAK
jgi:hypothetical protein